MFQRLRLHREKTDGFNTCISIISGFSQFRRRRNGQEAEREVAEMKVFALGVMWMGRWIGSAKNPSEGHQVLDFL